MSIGYYASLSELAMALDQIDRTDTDQIERFRRLLRIYIDASQNPPDGVIGVGIITHAEAALVSAQIDSGMVL